MLRRVFSVTISLSRSFSFASSTCRSSTTTGRLTSMFGFMPEIVAIPVFDAISELLVPVIVELLVDSDAKLVY